MKRLAGLISATALAVACGQTDAGITTAVKTKLAADDTVKAYQVNVDTQNKIVTLRGEVDSPVAETMAIQLARDTDGVRDVIDEIRVVPVVPTTGIDVDVDVDDNLEQDVKDAGSAVKNSVEKGADEVADRAKKVGGAIKDAVTDDDPDSNRDGK